MVETNIELSIVRNHEHADFAYRRDDDEEHREVVRGTIVWTLVDDCENISSLESERVLRAGVPSCHGNELESRATDFHENISRPKVAGLHGHPRFLDFKTMSAPIIQCFFWPNAWQVFCCCIFLNCTRRGQVEKVVWKFFELYPTPEVLLSTPDEEVQEVIRSLGFYRRRTTSLKRMSEDFVSKNWKRPEDLRSVGVYAATCYRMMFEFELGRHAPSDHALVDLWNWMRQELRYKFGRTLPHVRR